MVGAGHIIRDQFVNADLPGGDTSNRSDLLHHPAVLRGHLAAAQAPRVRLQVTYLLPLRRKHYRRHYDTSLWSYTEVHFKV